MGKAGGTDRTRSGRCPPGPLPDQPAGAVSGHQGSSPALHSGPGARPWADKPRDRMMAGLESRAASDLPSQTCCGRYGRGGENGCPRRHLQVEAASPNHPRSGPLGTTMSLAASRWVPDDGMRSGRRKKGRRNTLFDTLRNRPGPAASSGKSRVGKPWPGSEPSTQHQIDRSGCELVAHGY